MIASCHHLLQLAALSIPVSYTHLDVYKRQVLQCTIATGRPVGVVTISISGYTLASGRSSTCLLYTSTAGGESHPALKQTFCTIL